MERKRSDIWNFFTATNENSAKCNFCNSPFSYKGGAIGNLTRHLKRKHPFSLTDERRKDISVKDSETNVSEDISIATSDIELAIPSTSTNTSVVPKKKENYSDNINKLLILYFIKRRITKFCKR